MSRDNLILIGMPTSGKSSVGVILAKILGMDFVDSDLVIQKKAGKKLKNIIEERGLEGFLAFEEEVCKEISPENAVIATGGSVVYGAAAMEHFKEIGRVLYLDIGFELLTKRLRDVKQRGVVLWPDQSIRDLFEERIPLYEKYADIHIPEADQTTEETLQQILAALKEKED